MFVYGHTKTTAWTCVAVEQSRSANAISLDVELPAIGSGGLEFRQSLTLTRSPHVNHGPWHLEGGAAPASELKRNQTVFIRRLMASDRSSLDKIRYKMTYRIGRHDVSLGGPAVDKSAKERQQPSSEEIARSPQDRTRGASKYSSIIADLADFGMYSVLREEENEDHIFHIDPLEVLSLYILEVSAP
ncbi:hypothetical protein EWM64_g5014 [Hericium alpestre]|uniref:Uncharacterized protein n=1 Tax=Hericium alpestre TaxID=135208 RepID=A0A4Y9ZZX4_9AGAM|nr:hypothetical protein EWM64_g5014 [Hericium alpestre]